MKLRDVMNLSTKDIRNMSEKDFRKAVATLNSVANKRLINLKNAEDIDRTPITRIEKFYHINLDSVNFKFKNSKDIGEMKAQFSFLRNWLSSESSTVKGARQLKQKKMKALGLDVDNIDSVVDLIYSAMEEYQNRWGYYDSKQLAENIQTQILDNNETDLNKIIDNVHDVLTDKNTRTQNYKSRSNNPKWKFWSD